MIPRDGIQRDGLVTTRSKWRVSCDAFCRQGQHVESPESLEGNKEGNLEEAKEDQA